MTSASNLHIYDAKRQPATRQRHVISTPAGEHTVWVRLRRRQRVWCACCRRLRIAGNSHAQVYYDMTVYSCRPGKGCKA